MRGDIAKLVKSGRLAVGEELYHRGRPTQLPDVIARITSDGIEVNGTTYRSLSTAAARIGGHQTNGWTYWRVRATGQPVADLRKS